MLRCIKNYEISKKRAEKVCERNNEQIIICTKKKIYEVIEEKEHEKKNQKLFLHKVEWSHSNK